MFFLKPERFPVLGSENATGKYLRLAIISFSPFISIEHDGDEVVIKGPHVVYAAALKALSQHRIFAVVSSPPYGRRLQNGTFTGIMGMLQRNEADVFLGPSSNSLERSLIAEEALSVVTAYGLLTWRPEKVVDPFSFATSFGLDVWLCLAATLLLLPLIYWILTKYDDDQSPGADTESYFGFLWEIFSRIFPQEPSRRRSTWYRLCSMIFQLFISVTLMTYLNSQITSSMTIKKTEDSVNSYADVLRFDRVRFLSEKGTVLSAIFTNPKTELFRKLASKNIQTEGTFRHGPHLLNVLKQVSAKRRVVVCTRNMCDGMIVQGRQAAGHCPKVMTSSEDSGLLTAGLLLSRHLPADIRERLMMAVHICREAFLYSKQISWMYRKIEECTSKPRNTNKTEALNFSNVLGSFVVIAIGLCCSVLSFIVEFIWKRGKRR